MAIHAHYSLLAGRPLLVCLNGKVPVLRVETSEPRRPYSHAVGVVTAGTYTTIECFAKQQEMQTVIELKASYLGQLFVHDRSGTAQQGSILLSCSVSQQ